ncbi:MAG: DUF2490 domain-containing protein [Bacteroidales bacterium]|nr:DUF2490 domain-containing protein [Bacteroidales bacterium]
MKKIVLALALLVPLASFGQTFSTGGRASVGVDVKLAKGLHIEAGEEVRSADSFAGLGSLRTTLGISYKPLSFLKVGAGYTLINPYKIDKDLGDDYYYTGFWAPKHRAFADVTGTLKLGKFNLSLRERLQLTHNADDALNVYQSTRNAIALRSRLGVKYKGWKYVEPALSFEVRAALNDPWGTVSGSAQTTSNSKREYYTYTHTGYTHAYINRLRVNLGADITPNKHHSIGPYILLDYNMDYKIDTNGSSKWATEDGVRLFTDGTGWVYSTGLIFGLSYKYNF